mgnify:CR=1 FL=1
MKTIREVSKFIGYRMTEYKILKLDDHLHIDNFRKIMLAANGGDAKMANTRNNWADVGLRYLKQCCVQDNCS